MTPEIEKNWKQVLEKLNTQFGKDIDLQAILFLIGVQELGKGYQQFSKTQKVDIMHIAICTLLEQYDYYLYEGKDADNWPHWSLNEKLPPLEPYLQEQLIQQAIINYFEKQESLEINLLNQ